MGNISGKVHSHRFPAANTALPTANEVGTTFLDMENEGWLDLFVACGHVYPQMDNAKGSAAYAQPMLLHRNLRNRTF